MKDIRRLKCWPKLKEMGFVPTNYRFNGKVVRIGASLYENNKYPGRVLIDIVPGLSFIKGGYMVRADDYYYKEESRKQEALIKSILGKKAL